MKIKEKLFLDRVGLEKYGPINIVIFGDSVSHGAVNGYIDYENVYWNILKKKLNKLRDYMPVNMINASIGGTTAHSSLNRLESQALKHSPDLMIVCFGLNDVNGALDVYLNALKVIFEKSLTANSEVIFMTPNMLNTYVANDTKEEIKAYAAVTAEIQTSGKMDKYISEAIKTAEKCSVKICDCYSKWKELSKTQDTTMLLANRINHPKAEMHHLFADMLFETIFENNISSNTTIDNTMYKG